MGYYVLNVPNLRFPEFSGEWERCSLGDITTNFSRRNKEEVRYPMFSVTNNRGFVPQSEQFEDREMVGEDIKAYKIIHKNDFAYNPARINVGSIAKYNGDEPCMISSLYVCFTADKRLDNEWLMQLLKTPKMNFYYNINGEGGVRVYLFYPNFARIKTSFPSLQEQQKISSFLALLDERIATQIKIIEDLKKLKSAISKQIFVQKPICWNRLETLFIKGKAGGTPTSTNKDYYNGEIPFLSINDITKQGKYIRYTENHLSRSGLDNSSAWIVPAHSLIMSMYASVGLVSINEVPIATSQAMFAMQLKDKGLLDYLYYYLSYFKYRHIHKYLETGTQSNINADIVRSIMIPDYGHRHNIEIASTLQSIDAKIDNELSILEQFNKQKNYLLSQMFI